MDLPPERIAAARGAGVKFAIDTDAHSLVDLTHLPYGVASARFGGLTSADVINAWPLQWLEEFLRKGRYGWGWSHHDYDMEVHLAHGRPDRYCHQCKSSRLRCMQGLVRMGRQRLRRARLKVAKPGPGGTSARDSRSFSGGELSVVDTTRPDIF
jgi:hypothetical protein